MKYLYFISFILFATLSYGQDDFNFEVIANVTYPEGGNDIWGYVAEDDTEYAVVGTIQNTRIYSLADPTSPVEVITIEGTRTTWRDMKSYKDHIYVTADGDVRDGLLIIDMSQAPDSISHRYWRAPITLGDTTVNLSSCHNLFIDEKEGYMYLAGCNLDRDKFDEGGNKAVIYDLNEDRSNPTLVGVHGGENIEYAHDLMVQDNIMYSSEIYRGAIVLYDVTDKANIEYLGEAPTSFNFTHNAWVSTDGNYVYTTDERENAFVDAYDISDYDNIKRIDQFQPQETAVRGVIPHNTHFIDDYLVTSWYTDGVVITDASRPDNLIKVGAFDTFLGEDGGFNGCWGAYPYLPSGLLLANDRSNGLYVFRPNYVRACYLEGLITDIDSGEPINGAEIEILSDIKNGELSKSNGEYKTGLATAGTYMVRFKHIFYEDLIAEAILDNGVLTILDVQLKRLPHTISGLMVEAGTNNPIRNGIGRVKSSEREYPIKSDGDGEFTIYVDSEAQQIIGAKWGYKHKVVDFDAIGDQEVILEMEVGYMDDFVLDQGWTENGNDGAGAWERAVPFLTEFQGNPSNVGADVEGDIGDYAFVTGNGYGFGSVGKHDVDRTTILTSPEMDLSNYENPVIKFKLYYYNGAGNGPANDSLVINVTDRNRTITRIIKENTDNWSETMTIDLADEPDFDFSNPITISFNASESDEEPANLLECGLDVFRVNEAGQSSVAELDEGSLLLVYPNPVDDILNIETDIDDIIRVELFNELGQKVYSSSKLGSIGVAGFNAGTYLLSLDRENGEKVTAKVLIK